MKWKIIPISLKQANDFVNLHHRHHKQVQGHKFSIGLCNENKLVGVAICGRPVARFLDNGLTLEVTRLCTDGTPNACSKLYAQCARIAKEMGYEKIITYIMETENGASLKASNWILEDKSCGGKPWNHPGRPRPNEKNICKRQRWVKILK